MRAYAIKKDFYKYFDGIYSLIAEVQFRTGLRISDVLNLKVYQLKRQPTITELKTGKKRRIYLNTKLLEKLKNRAVKMELTEKDYVFAKRKGEKPPHRSTIWRQYKKVAHYVYKTPRHVSPHSSRKTYTQSKANTMSVAQIKNKIGHDNLATTLLYLYGGEKEG